MAEIKRDILSNAENLVKKFDMARKAFKLYPTDTPIPSES